jgi:hypothetical protein
MKDQPRIAWGPFLHVLGQGRHHEPGRRDCSTPRLNFRADTAKHAFRPSVARLAYEGPFQAVWPTSLRLKPVVA